MLDWDDAYANMAHVPGAAELPARWAADAAAYRLRGGVEEDIRYGELERERLDIVWPEREPVGLAVFVHGGYWMRLGKSDWTHFAAGARAAGWAVCLPGYTLTPQVRIRAITAQIGCAINTAAARVAGPICLAGHSAGGHLVSRMLCEDSPLQQPVRDRLRHTLSISGLHDLRPLLRTAMNQTLQLDAEEAAGESAALLAPLPQARLTAWVGGEERPEFIRQARLLDLIWRGFDVSVDCVVDAGHNHFSIIAGLQHSESPICQAFLLLRMQT